jgi:hypothetical protein
VVSAADPLQSLISVSVEKGEEIKSSLIQALEAY